MRDSSTTTLFLHDIPLDSEINDDDDRLEISRCLSWRQVTLRLGGIIVYRNDRDPKIGTSAAGRAYGLGGADLKASMRLKNC